MVVELRISHVFSYGKCQNRSIKYSRDNYHIFKTESISITGRSYVIFYIDNFVSITKVAILDEYIHSEETKFIGNIMIMYSNNVLESKSFAYGEINANKFRNSLMNYLWMLQHCDSYQFKRKLLDAICL